MLRLVGPYSHEWLLRVIEKASTASYPIIELALYPNEATSEKSA
jgi:hypothetical protein